MNVSLIARAIDADLLDRMLEIDAECIIQVDAEMGAGTASLWSVVE